MILYITYIFYSVVQQHITIKYFTSTYMQLLIIFEKKRLKTCLFCGGHIKYNLFCCVNNYINYLKYNLLNII